MTSPWFINMFVDEYVRKVILLFNADDAMLLVENLSDLQQIDCRI